MKIAIYIVAVVVLFVLGKFYGARAEEAAVDTALSAFTRARLALVRVTNKALVDVKVKEARLVERIAKHF